MSTGGACRWIVLLAVAASACHDPRAEPRRTAAAASRESRAGEAASSYSSESLTAFEQALRERAGERATALMLELFPDHALAQVGAVNRLGQLEQYEFRDGTLTRGVPVELRGKGVLAQNLFPLSSIDFRAIPKLVDAARARVDPDYGQVSRILIRRNLPQEECVSMRVYVESPLRSGQVDADAHGKLLESQSGCR